MSRAFLRRETFFKPLILRNRKMKSIKRFIKEEKGLETIEYAIVAGLIVVGIVATLTSIGVWVAAQFTALDNDLTP
jgi:pilus assembly protein Flp/PilA